MSYFALKSSKIVSFWGLRPRIPSAKISGSVPVKDFKVTLICGLGQIMSSISTLMKLLWCVTIR